MNEQKACVSGREKLCDIKCVFCCMFEHELVIKVTLEHRLAFELYKNVNKRK